MQPGHGRASAAELNCWISDQVFFFSSLIYHTAGLQTHPSLRMLHLPQPHQAGAGPAGAVTHTPPATRAQ